MPRRIALGLVLGTVCAWAYWLSGCGGASAEVRTAYAVEQAACLANERAIIDEPCGTLDAEACRARDYEAMRVERARCDAALAAIYGGE